MVRSPSVVTSTVLASVVLPAEPASAEMVRSPVRSIVIDPPALDATALMSSPNTPVVRSTEPPVLVRVVVPVTSRPVPVIVPSSVKSRSPLATRLAMSGAVPSRLSSTSSPLIVSSPLKSLFAFPREIVPSDCNVIVSASITGPGDATFWMAAPAPAAVIRTVPPSAAMRPASSTVEASDETGT